MTMENVTLPLLLIVAASIFQGSFGLGMKNFKPLAWEAWWFVYSLVAMVILPLAWALAVVPDLPGSIAASPPDAVLKGILFGFLWGVGGILFGMSVTQIGLSLTYGIVMGTGVGCGIAGAAGSDPHCSFTARLPVCVGRRGSHARRSCDRRLGRSAKGSCAQSRRRSKGFRPAERTHRRHLLRRAFGTPERRFRQCCLDCLPSRRAWRRGAECESGGLGGRAIRRVPHERRLCRLAAAFAIGRCGQPPAARGGRSVGPY